MVDADNQGHESMQYELPLHELCRMVKFIDHVEDEEFSDMEEQIFDKKKIARIKKYTGSQDS